MKKTYLYSFPLYMGVSVEKKRNGVIVKVWSRESVRHPDGALVKRTLVKRRVSIKKLENRICYALYDFFTDIFGTEEDEYGEEDVKYSNVAGKIAKEIAKDYLEEIQNS